MSTITNDKPDDRLLIPQKISLSEIRTNCNTQVRVKLSRETYLDYKEMILEGIELPPIVLFWGQNPDGLDGDNVYMIADGFHRFYGAREAKQEKIAAIVHQGDYADALLYAAGANSKHGLKMSAEDKRNTVLMLLRDSKWGKKSAAWIAGKCGFSNSFVSKLRAEHESTLLEKGCEPKTYEGRDGKKRKLPVNKPKNKRVEQADEQVIIPMVAAVKELEPLSQDEQRRLEELEGVIAANIDALRNDGPCPHGGDHVPDADGDCKRCFEPGIAPPAAGDEPVVRTVTKPPFDSLSQAIDAMTDAVAKVAERWPAAHQNMLPLHLESLIERYQQEGGR